VSAVSPPGGISGDFLDELDRRLSDADERLTGLYPGDSGSRQPVHTVYVPAHRATDDTPRRWGDEALRLFGQTAPDAAAATTVTGLVGVDPAVHERVLAKLRAQPVEDLRLDFEDGYGRQPDDEEDAAATTAGGLLGRLLASSDGPSFAGIRFKSLEAATRRRGLRTLDLVLGTLVRHGPLPDGFVLTLPKVTSVDQVEGMVTVCEHLEDAHGLAEGQLRFEIQVETPQAIVSADGTAAVAPMLHRAGHRCIGLHYGTYDYSAACGISAAQQSMEHPAADHAKAVMQVAAAGTGVRLSDGSTNVIPVGTHDEVSSAMRLHARLVRRSLDRGYYQGWDMHPGHLVTRYLATYAFYREGLPAAAARLRDYTSGAAGGGVMDEPATAAALASFLVRGLHCGALDDTEVASGTGLDRRSLETLAQGPGPAA
jgi:citrate lyase beta subunit